MMKNWIIGALMSVILLCATDVVAQEQALVEQEGKAFIAKDGTLTCSCGKTGIVSHETETETRKIPGVSFETVIVKSIYRCTNRDGHNNGRGQAWYTDDKHPKWVRKYVEVDDSVKSAEPQHICCKENGCLKELPYTLIGGGWVKRTIIRLCESTDTLIVHVKLGSEEKWTLQMIGKTPLEIETPYTGNIECEYFAPAQHRSAKKPTTQGTNGKRKPRVMLRSER